MLLLITLATIILAGCSGSVNNPPIIYLVSNGELVDGFQSSYCWDQGIGGTLCVDSVEPFFESSTPLDASAPIRLQLDSPLPDAVTLSLSKEVFGETIVSESMPVTEFIEWSPSVAPGEYILDVHGSWKQGDVTYWFSINLE
ncbi:MAG: hypothetical protein WBL25_09160 [Anaerolineales bacterium]